MFLNKCVGTGFSIKPVNQEVMEGENATFSCRFPGALSVAFLRMEITKGVSTNDVMTNGVRVHTLTITAFREYNLTVIVCLATLPSEELCFVNATLLIRGMQIAHPPVYIVSLLKFPCH